MNPRTATSKNYQYFFVISFSLFMPIKWTDRLYFLNPSRTYFYNGQYFNSFEFIISTLFFIYYSSESSYSYPRFFTFSCFVFYSRIYSYYLGYSSSLIYFSFSVFFFFASFFYQSFFFVSSSALQQSRNTLKYSWPFSIILSQQFILYSAISIECPIYFILAFLNNKSFCLYSQLTPIEIQGDIIISPQQPLTKQLVRSSFFFPGAQLDSVLLGSLYLLNLCSKASPVILHYRQ